MSVVIDLTNQRFTRWLVESFSHQNGKMFYWNCICDCGTKRQVFGADLKRGGSKSCGCLSRELKKIKATKHDLCDHPMYSSWTQLRSRCNNSNNTMYHLYGGRGISVCERWNNFKLFYEDMISGWQEGMSIDRIDNNGNYEPNNCKWSDATQQANNRGSNHLINTIYGDVTIAQAAKLSGVPYNTIRSRIRYGWKEGDLLLPAKRWQ